MRCKHIVFASMLFGAGHISAQTKHLTVTTVYNERVKKVVLEKVDSARYYGLRKESYNFSWKPGSQPSGDENVLREKQFTDALLTFVTDLYKGADIASYIRNDEVSGAYKKTTDSFIVAWMLALNGVADVNRHFALLEPGNAVYRILKGELKQQIDSGNRKKVGELTTAINLFRWIQHINAEKYIVVNIPAASLDLYHLGTLKLNMNVVVGKPSTRTPRLSTWCDNVVLYPYWNVPEDIARKELLPKFKKSPSKIAAMNMQILNANGKIVDPFSLNWSSFNQGYFPYTIRQCTGCDNSLGVIKFDLTDAFSVYMHDTNNKLAFLSNHRYLSHGCIRVSKPIELGNELLDNKLDSNFLKACFKNQEPVVINIKKPIPVFIVYMTATADRNGVKYFKDIYQLNK